MSSLPRAKKWSLKTRSIEFSNDPILMGILNVTPDSFSDGGNYANPETAVEHAIQLERDGAGIIDVGGESTRPYSDPVELEEELRRTIPVIEKVCESVSVPVSIDTSKAKVALEAVNAGAEIINDVTGLEGDPDMVDVALKTGAGICAMHMKGSVQTMQDNPRYDNVVEEIYQYLVRRREYLVGEGIELAKICLDPGVGFGKTHEHNWQLVHSAGRFLEAGCPVLVGHSRKGFVGKLEANPDIERDSASLGIAIHLASCGVHVIRLHEIAQAQRALRAWARCQ